MFHAFAKAAARTCSVAAVAVALLAACQAWPLPNNADPAGDWTVSTDNPASIVGLSLHHTRQGYAGRVMLADGRAVPVRNIEITNGSMSFIAPALDMAFTGRWDAAEKRWIASSVVGGEQAALSLVRRKTVISAQSGNPYTHPQQLVRLPDGREMNLHCMGKGSPAVILDYGAGGTSADWSDVHAGMAATTRVCAYDRAGHGFSDPGPLPRDAAAVVGDLRAMLKAAKIPGPYVLVGHSLGSLHVRLFANLHLNEVAGMVLVDPSGDHQFARIDKAVPKMAAMRGNSDGLRRCIAAARQGLVRKDSETYRQCRQNDPDLMESRMSESESMSASSSDQAARSRRSYGDLPLIVLTRSDNAGAPPQLTQADIDAYYAVWKEMHREFAALSTAGVQRIVPQASHYIQRDKPDIVIAAVNEVVTAVRAKAAQ